MLIQICFGRAPGWDSPFLKADGAEPDDQTKVLNHRRGGVMARMYCSRVLAFGTRIMSHLQCLIVWYLIIFDARRSSTFLFCRKRDSRRRCAGVDRTERALSLCSRRVG